MKRKKQVPGQLKMLMTADEITAQYGPTESDRGWRNKTGYETDEQVWSRKRQEADVNGLTESIARRGVVNPVMLGSEIGRSGKPGLTHGNHRVAGAMGSRQFIPVLHFAGGRDQMLADLKRMGRQP